MMVNNSAQMAAAHQQQTEKKDKDDREAAKRRAKKPTDKNIPEGVENIIIGEGVQQYRSMREMERKLDAIMMRKRLDFQDARAQTSERTGRLRVWISNTVENQPWQGKDLDENAFDFNSGMEPTYKVKIEGRLLDDSELDGIADDDEDDGGGCTNEQLELGTVAMERDGQGATAKKLRASVLPRRKLSWFFKSITVEYDRTKTLQPDGTTSIEWKKPPVSPGSVELPATSDFDSLEFERKSDENINCTISFYRDESPERHALSKDLADLVDMEEGTREAIVTGIWEYIKALGLQQDEEKRIIQCDDRLRAVSLPHQALDPVNMALPDFQRRR
jgi:SWI/SNF-related matrix-associated actin-dependent regulator of chromatin subfamily D